MSRAWFFKRSGGIVGPVDIKEIEYCINKGVINEQTQIRFDNEPWQDAMEILPYFSKRFVDKDGNILSFSRVKCHSCNKNYRIAEKTTVSSFVCTNCGNNVRLDDNSSEGADVDCRKRRSIPEAVRHAVWRRDMGRCVLCGTNESLEFDHIIPLSKGGSDTERNLQLLCETCNRTKSDSI